MSRRPYHRVRALVLGASGFIGAWVARALCAQGAHVHLVVRDSVRARSVFDRFGVIGEIVETDLRRYEEVEKVVSDIQPEVTFNLAGYGVDPSEREFATAYQINDCLVDRLCRAIAHLEPTAWQGPRLIHVGSVLEYGVIDRLVEDEPPRPDTLYGQSKLAGTERVAAACRQLRLRAVTARLFTVYGPGEHTGRLLPALISAARDGTSLELTAGRQKRDFTYIEDVTQGLLRVGCASPSPGEVVNLATGRLSSVREFAETAARVLGIPSERLLFGALPTRAEEIEQAEVSVKRLRDLTDWLPSTSVEAGVRRTLAFLALPDHDRRDTSSQGDETTQSCKDGLLV